MKDRVLQNISAVVAALNTVTVSGKNNLANLSGSIAILEELYTALGACEIIAPETNTEKEDQE